MKGPTGSTGGAAPGLAALIDASSDAPLGQALRGAVFHYVRLLANGPGLATPVRDALAATPAERVLDLGCGCGGFSLAVPGEYIGIDLDPRYIAFARRRFGDAHRRFACMNLADLDGSETFDKAIMASVLHHLSDRDAHTVLGQLARVVRSRVVVMDLDPGSANWFQRLLINNDRGRFVRPAAQQRALLARHFRVTGEHRFANAWQTAVHTLFVCEPASS